MKAEILAIISVGGSRRDAAAYVGISHNTIENETGHDAEFLTSLARCEIDCKRKHLEIVANADDWRASIAFLSRKFPSEWSESHHLDHSHKVNLAGQKGVTVVTDENWFRALGINHTERG